MLFYYFFLFKNQLNLSVSEENGTFYASFQPQEAGEWRIHVTYDNQDIDNSPFKCMVFNPRAIFVRVFKQFMASIGAFIGIIDRTLLNGKFEDLF